MCTTYSPSLPDLIVCALGLAVRYTPYSTVLTNTTILLSVCQVYGDIHPDYKR